MLNPIEKRAANKKNKLAEAMSSLYDVIVFDSLDYSSGKREAWMYGIIVGWNGPAMDSIAKKFNWTKEDVERLRSYRKAWREYENRNALKAVPDGK